MVATGEGTLRLGCNSTAFGDSFAPLNISDVGVAAFTVTVEG